MTIHFTSARTSNLLRALQTLFGFEISQRRFYAFMDSPKLPWARLWLTLWSAMTPSADADGRLLLALDDFINPKTGKKIFGCASVFDHAAKLNQSSYPWAQNILSIGLLKQIKGRWAYLPMAFRFYHMKKIIEAGLIKIKGKAPVFQTKFEQTVDMFCEISKAFPGNAILVVTDSWFGNNGLFAPMRERVGRLTDILSRLRVNSNLFDLPGEPEEGQLGRRKKYGKLAGNV